VWQTTCCPSYSLLAMAKHAASVPARQDEGNDHFRAQRYEEALACYDAAIGLGPDRLPSQLLHPVSLRTDHDPLSWEGRCRAFAVGTAKSVSPLIDPFWMRLRTGWADTAGEADWSHSWGAKVATLDCIVLRIPWSLD
jgi:hypothetical protein